MKKTIVVSLALALALSGCGAQRSASTAETAAAQPAATPESTATPEPNYDGPLYEVSFEKIQDTIPAFRDPSISGAKQVDNSYRGLILRTDFAHEGVIEVDSEYYGSTGDSSKYYSYFCTTDLQPVPLEGDYEFLGAGNGYYLFAYVTGDHMSKHHVQVYDSDFNLVYDSTGVYDLQSEGPCNIYASTGWIPGKKLATGEEGYFNLYTQEWRAMPSGQQLSGFDFVGYNMYSYYTEGMAPVWGSGTQAKIGWAPYTEYPILGFIDENGDWALRFADLPAFDNLTVNSYTGFLNGECLICAHDKGYLPSDFDEITDMLYRQYIYRIDKDGNILGETDYENYEKFYEDVMHANHERSNSIGGDDGNYSVEEAQIADGLTLRMTNPLKPGMVATDAELNQYELVDCNGHEYDLPEGEVSGAIVGDNGVVMLCMNEYRSAEDDGLALSGYMSTTYQPWYTLKLNYIAPDDYTVPDNQKKNLTPSEDAVRADAITVMEEQFTLSQPAGVHDMKLHFSCMGMTRDYDVQESDYKTRGNYVEINVKFRWLDNREPDDYYYEYPVITAEWVDGDGVTHHGTDDGHGFTEDTDETTDASDEM